MNFAAIMKKYAEQFLLSVKSAGVCPEWPARPESDVIIFRLAQETSTMQEKTVETSVAGKWTKVPALEVSGKNLIVKGRLLKLAIVLDEEWLETELEDPELCVKRLKERGLQGRRADVFTFAQKLPSTNPRYEYYCEWDSIAAVRITSYQDWWEGVPQESRKNVRRSQKRGVVVSVGQLDERLIKGLMELNNDSPVRQGRPYVHYGKSIEQVRKDQSSLLDRSDLICAYCADELIGFMKLVYRGEVASILQLLPKMSHQDKRPANALIAKAVELCAARGVSYLTYGKFNYGNKRDNPLREFKVRSGFEEILVPRFYVPLTTWGKLCMKMKFHRGLLGILPHRLITSFVTARTIWYHLKQGISRCSSTLERPNRTRQMGCSSPPAGSNRSYSILDPQEGRKQA
jgi:hypothetical protein